MKISPFNIIGFLLIIAFGVIMYLIMYFISNKKTEITSNQKNDNPIELKEGRGYPNDGKLYYETKKIEGHEYLILYSGHGLGITHLPECKFCK